MGYLSSNITSSFKSVLHIVNLLPHTISMQEKIFKKKKTYCKNKKGVECAHVSKQITKNMECKVRIQKLVNWLKSH